MRHCGWLVLFTLITDINNIENQKVYFDNVIMLTATNLQTFA